MNKTLAIVFPGQGSQKLNMMSSLANDSSVKQIFEEASSVLSYDLWRLIEHGPIEKLNETQITQPAILAASMAFWTAYLNQGGEKPSVMAGHSLGEFSALVCAGALKFSEAIQLVALRGELMQAAVPVGEGAMAAVLGLEDADIIAACKEIPELVEAANFNSPGQVVISGSKVGVEKAAELLKARGAKRVLMLPVSVPSHCRLMQPAADQFKVALEKISFSTPEIPVIHNADLQVYEDVHQIKQALVNQLTSPVRWVGTIQRMQALGIHAIKECGPGSVLTGLNKRILSHYELTNGPEHVLLTAINLEGSV